jgi:hypothetical protein
MATRFEILQRERDVRAMLTTGVPAKRIVPFLIEKYEIKRSVAYSTVQKISEQLLQEGQL